MAQVKRPKKGSEEVDRLVAEVDKLHRNGMSVNKACAKVGIQPTVYYFRKRKEAAEAIEASAGTNIFPPAATIKQKPPLSSFEDLDDLSQEYKELENRLKEIKMKIGEKYLSKSL